MFITMLSAIMAKALVCLAIDPFGLLGLSKGLPGIWINDAN